ncbi:MAG: hypothetical protein WA232_08415, partial [Candidatus Sulfotelmatobacter sp.]
NNNARSEKLSKCRVRMKGSVIAKLPNLVELTLNRVSKSRDAPLVPGKHPQPQVENIQAALVSNS